MNGTNTATLTGIKTLGELKKSGYVSKSIKDEIRENLILKITAKENPFPGILGYEDTVIPDTERALLSRHNMLFLGLRGQAKTRMARQMVQYLWLQAVKLMTIRCSQSPVMPWI